MTKRDDARIAQAAQYLKELRARKLPGDTRSDIDLWRSNPPPGDLSNTPAVVDQDGNITILTRTMQREMDEIRQRYNVTEQGMGEYHLLRQQLIVNIRQTLIGGKSHPLLRDLEIRELRKRVRQMFDIERAVEETERITKSIDVTEGLTELNTIYSRWLDATWFDVREITYFNSEEEREGYLEMAAHGRELMDAGVCKLPFNECVFVTRSIFDIRGEGPIYSNTAGGTLLALVKQEGTKFAIEDPTGCFYSTGDLGKGSRCARLKYEEGTPGFDLHASFADFIYFCVAVMATKYVQSTRRNLFATKANPNPREKADPKLDYYVVDLLPEVRDQLMSGGTHASPRMHWRRGHVRTYHRDEPNQRQIWIETTLVGVADHGIVVKDYAARRGRQAQ